MFIQGDSKWPEILVVINDADWELLGELDYQLQDQDKEGRRCPSACQECLSLWPDDPTAFHSLCLSLDTE